ncbi:MAG TPA: MFS transporter [Rhodopila sp.]|nr:MFS transporter [Rhodopila sp.]
MSAKPISAEPMSAEPMSAKPISAKPISAESIPATKTDARRWRVLAVVVAAQFVFVVDAFIVNVAIPAIRLDLHAAAGEMQAVIAIYQIAYATMVITGGRLGDIFGRRRLFILGVLGFAAASLWCGLSRTGAELVTARLAQGAAAALMVPQVLATIHTLFPDAARARAFAVFGIALGLGGAAGFALGGWLVTLDIAGLGWRTVFLVNLPVCAAIALAAARLMPRTLPRTGIRLDIPGALLLFVALNALISPIMAGHDLGWPAWLWAIMAAGALLLPVFLRLEQVIARRGGTPLIDLALLRDRSFLHGLATVFAFQFGNIAFYLLITLFLQGQLGFSPLQGGLAVVPLALAFAVASRLAGRWVTRYGIRTLLLGCLIQFAGIAALAAVALWLGNPGTALIMAVLTIFGFGQGLVMAPLSGLALATVQPAHAGSAAGLLNTVHQTAGATGVSCIGLLAFQGHMPGALSLLGGALILTMMLIRAMRPSTEPIPQTLRAGLGPTSRPKARPAPSGQRSIP